MRHVQDLKDGGEKIRRVAHIRRPAGTVKFLHSNGRHRSKQSYTSSDSMSVRSSSAERHWEKGLLWTGNALCIICAKYFSMTVTARGCLIHRGAWKTAKGFRRFVNVRFKEKPSQGSLSCVEYHVLVLIKRDLLPLLPVLVNF